MEFVEGNTATYWLQAQTRSWQEILKVFLAAGRGLAAAHDKGLVHRDFKPDNVMVGRDSQVRVMDFGLARQVTEKTARHRRRPIARLDKPVAPAEDGTTPTLRIPAAGGGARRRHRFRQRQHDRDRRAPGAPAVRRRRRSPRRRGCSRCS